jgi:TPR repeat protein
VFKLAADQGHADAQFHSGVMLYRGYDVQMNNPLDAHYFKWSADQGVAWAQVQYAVMLYHGDGILKNKSLLAPAFCRPRPFICSIHDW